MSNPKNKEVQTMFASDVVVTHQTIHLWESVDYLAAKTRLNLARRYQNQYDSLTIEFANLRASQSWLATQDNENAACLLIAYLEVLAPYLRQRGLGVELLRWCEDGLRASERLQQNSGWLLLLQGETQNALGRWDAATASFQTAIEISEGEASSTHAQAVLALGRLQFNQGDYVIALETLTRAEGLLSELSDYERLATVRSERAAYYLNRGDFDKALALYLEVDQLRKQAGASESSDHTLLMLGVVYRKKKDYERATACLRQLLERSEAHHNQGATATAAHHLGWVYLDQGNLSSARSLCGRAIALYEETGDTRGASDAYEQLGCIALAEGQVKEAVPHFQRSLVIRRQLGNQHGAASSLRRLAIAHVRMRHLGAALWYLWQSLATYRRIGMLSRQRFITILRECFQWRVEQWDGRSER